MGPSQLSSSPISHTLTLPTMSQPIVHLGDIQPRAKVFTVWEKQRNRREVHWFVECFAEALGVFFYVYAGVGSTVGWVIGNILKEVGLSSLLQIGFGYMAGILLALGVCASTSGGHFNPCVSIAFVLFKGFPRMKALRYIVAQILGAYIACLLVYSQYKLIIVECEAHLQAAGKLDALQFTPNGLAGIFAFYLLPGQSLARTFLNEFVTDVFIGLAIWASLDPANVIVPPVMAPFLVALAYASAIWGFATPGLVANSARDIGGRLMAVTIWGTEAAGGRYAAIAALTNIPATIFAAFIYEFFLVDSDRVVPRASLEFGTVVANHRRHRKEAPSTRDNFVDSDSKLESQADDKPTAFTYEVSGTAPR
ncbi:Propanediol diffusion facilitator [Hypsizygus marmoreus]|uniref:Propanediol diffusion facilitator n=1 Tax=Hypsizygus marmoreus TaxID=39966 RepID=A0A369JZ55_HYPMA|nr:Propanediol diffusion facilitator [Hypsizygus marmoreus]